MDDDPRTPSHGVRRWLIGGIAVAVLALCAGLWFAARSDQPDDPDFCRRVAELPALSASAAETGTPAEGFGEFAEQLDELAADADDRGGERSGEIAAAARILAEHQRSMADILGGSVSADDVVEQVSDIDPASVEAARTTLADTIDERCG